MNSRVIRGYIQDSERFFFSVLVLQKIYLDLVPVFSYDSTKKISVPAFSSAPSFRKKTVHLQNDFQFRFEP